MSETTNQGVSWVRSAAVLAAVAVATVGVMFLLENIATRKEEARSHVFRVTEINEGTIDPAEWGKNYPRQYDSYKRTVDIVRTRYGGSEAFSHIAERDSMWEKLWAGYAFSVEYNEDRGHAYMLSDQEHVARVTRFKQPGACLHCHSSVLPAYRKVGRELGADPQDQWDVLMRGFLAVNAMPYAEARKLVEHPISCIDCHDPSNMQLRITRPGFLNGIRAFASSDDPAPHLPSIERWRRGNRSREYDPNRDASRQEMRSFVCGQCHVEYYFKGDSKTLTYPWHNGLKMEQIEAYYDGLGYKDWMHRVDSAPLLKAQHPEFEMWSQGIHARSGVACADCHMPYMREGAIKVSDHHVRSPLLNVARACQTCHRFPESEILARAQIIQDRNKALLTRAEDATLAALNAIRAAMEAGAGDEALRAARQLHRKAQWRLDFVSAENSMGFHAPQEAARILAEAVDYARQGEAAAKLAQQAVRPRS